MFKTVRRIGFRGLYVTDDPFAGLVVLLDRAEIAYGLALTTPQQVCTNPGWKRT